MACATRAQDAKCRDACLAYVWCMWQQMLKHQYGEQPYWEDHKTHAYRGTIVRTGQRFYTEIYYRESGSEPPAAADGAEAAVEP